MNAPEGFHPGGSLPAKQVPDVHPVRRLHWSQSPGVRERRVRAPVHYQADGLCMVFSYLFTNRLDADFEKTKATWISPTG